MISPRHTPKNWLSRAKRLPVSTPLVLWSGHPPRLTIHPEFPPLHQLVFRREENQAFVINIVKSFLLERAHPREARAEAHPRERNRILGSAHQHGLQ